MDKNAIKKYAVWARRELISRVSQKAYQYGIKENSIIDANVDSIDGKILTDYEKKERKALIAQVQEKGFEQVMEEVAYTWFNRFSALRFMEVNGYLPSHVRVFTDEENNFKPQILTEAIHMKLDGLEMDKVYSFVEADNKDELYKYLLITQCNALNRILPRMFQKIADYTELLFPDNLLREGSVIEQMISSIPEEDWKDTVQIIGWLYQYYNSEPKDTVFANLKKNIKITKENIPAATQLFTPDWIVRYMVENTLGRLWLEGHPDDDLKAKWNYYLDETEQEADVQAQLTNIREEYKTIQPEGIRIIDPCMGSGHILVYAFDVLIQIYETYGFNQRDAVKNIVENNLYGLDIDERAAQLAYFAVMMKARQYDRRFFSRDVQPHVYAIRESNHLDKFCVEYFANSDTNLKADIQILMNELYDAKEYGSILNIADIDFNTIYTRFEELRDEVSIYRELIYNDLLPFVKVAQVMAQKYDVVVTNPPYMGSSGMSSKLSEFVKENYSDTKSDMSTICMEKTLHMCKMNGFMAMINIPVWMSLSSYEKLRYNLIEKNTIVNMVHFGRGVFGSDFGTTSFVIAKKHIAKYKGNYRRLFQKQGAVDSLDVKEKWFLEGMGQFSTEQENFSKIPGSPIAYWVSENTFKSFELQNVSEYISPRIGLVTGDTDRFLKLWYEVCNNRIFWGCNSLDMSSKSKMKWFPYQKGGAYRKWYGNNEYVINWENDGWECKNDNFSGNRVKSHNYNGEYSFRSAITWTKITIGSFACRYVPYGFMFDDAGPICSVSESDAMFFLALLNSKIGSYYLSILSPTVNFLPGNINAIPIDYKKIKENSQCKTISEQQLKLSKADWDSFEISWDFTKHPLVCSCATIKNAYEIWNNEAIIRFNQLKTNEEQLNHILIDIYGLQDELTPEVEEKDVTVRKADLLRDIKGLLSYAVGCMFGRYSLYTEGLLYAGGVGGDLGSLVERIQYSLKEMGLSMFPENEFYPDADNIIPICDDEYFTDDIIGRFVKFIETVYGVDTLEENLKFIADALGGKGSARDVIRNYFLNDFYNDHCKMYQKRPIYWLFDSGKKNGFKALIYMHRYQPDTIACMRTDYVHEQQERYRTAIVHLEQRINDATTSERVKMNKQLGKLKEQESEIKDYEEKIHHLADQMIRIDLDDGVNHNYETFKDVLAKIK